MIYRDVDEAASNFSGCVINVTVDNELNLEWRRNIDDIVNRPTLARDVDPLMILLVVLYTLSPNERRLIILFLILDRHVEDVGEINVCIDDDDVGCSQLGQVSLSMMEADFDEGTGIPLAGLACLIFFQGVRCYTCPF